MSREKVTSIYIHSSEEFVYEEFKRFKQDRDKFALTHTDLYKTGLALFKANASLVPLCKMLLINDRIDQLGKYIAMELDIDVNNSIVLDSTLKDSQVSELYKLLISQSNKLDILTEVIRSQTKLIETLKQENHSSQQGERNAQDDHSNSESNSESESESESDTHLEPAQENDKQTISWVNDPSSIINEGVVRETNQIHNSNKTMMKLAQAKRKAIL